MEAVRLKRKCPICSNASGITLNTQKYILPDNHPLKNGYDVVICNQCGFVYADTDSVQADYDKFYNSFSKYEEGASIIGSGLSVFDYNRLHGAAEYISKKIDITKSILDVGSANGGLLKELRENGHTKLSAYDPSGFCVEYIKKNMGIEAINGSIFDIQKNFSADKKYDLVILSHVLEHLLDVSGAFEQIDHLLKEESHFYIEVPDASKYTEYFVSPLHYFDTEHINHFSTHYLKLLAQKFDFTVVDEGEKEIQLSDNTIYPAIYVLLKKNNIKNKNESVKFIYDDTLAANIRRYIAKSFENFNLPLIEKISKDNREFIFWGVGSTTLRLLASTDLRKAKIKFFVDNNPKTHSSDLLGKKVYSADEIKGHKDPIVVFSKIYKNEIENQIRKELKLENEIIFLN